MFQKKYFMALAALYVTTIPSSINAATTDAGATSSTDLGIRFDCTHHFNRTKGGKQDCIGISGIRLRFKESIDDKIQAVVTVDPFATTAHHFDSAPNRSLAPQTKDTPLAFIDYYGLTWSARANMSVVVEEFRGSTNLPQASGLAFEGSLEDSPWEQTAISLNYLVPVLKGLAIQVTLGNGEGENTVNVDAQQFLGLRMQATLAEGLNLNLGTSYDGNNVGSASFDWFYKNNFTAATMPSIGFQTQRFAAALEVDGKIFGAQGLNAMLGWQRTTAKDLDANQDSVPNVFINNDPGIVLVEDPTKQETNAVTRNLFAASVAYKILATYFIGVGYEYRTINTGGVDFFERCSAIANNLCAQPGSKTPDIVQSALNVGAGVELSKNLRLILEYYRQSYNDLFANFHYLDPTGRATETLELFNARIAYRWD